MCPSVAFLLEGAHSLCFLNLPKHNLPHQHADTSLKGSGTINFSLDNHFPSILRTGVVGGKVLRSDGYLGNGARKSPAVMKGVLGPESMASQTELYRWTGAVRRECRTANLIQPIRLHSPATMQGQDPVLLHQGRAARKTFLDLNKKKK